LRDIVDLSEMTSGETSPWRSTSVL